MTTTASQRHASLFDRLLSWSIFGTAIVAALCYLASDVNAPWGLMCLPLAPMALLGWVVLLIRNLLALRDSSRRKPRWVLWSGVPVIVIVAYILSSAGVPMKLALWVSRPAMDALAREVLAAPEGTTFSTSRSLGVFDADAIHRFPGGMAFRTERGNWFDWCGFAYVPSGVPPTLDGYYFEKPVGGNWFEVLINTSPYPNNKEPIPTTTRP